MPQHHNAGFTLKELAIATAIIAVLAMIGNYFFQAALLRWHGPQTWTHTHK